MKNTNQFIPVANRKLADLIAGGAVALNAVQFEMPCGRKGVIDRWGRVVWQEIASPIAYLSGPISNVEGYNREAFEDAARKVAHMGYQVISPMNSPKGLTETQYMAISMVNLPLADLVVELPNAEHSKGAVAERALAEKLNIPVITLSDFQGGAECE